MLFLRSEKAPAGMSLLRNAIFEARKGPCGHAAAEKCYFLAELRIMNLEFRIMNYEFEIQNSEF